MIYEERTKPWQRFGRKQPTIILNMESSTCFHFILHRQYFYIEINFLVHSSAMQQEQWISSSFQGKCIPVCRSQLRLFTLVFVRKQTPTDSQSRRRISWMVSTIGLQSGVNVTFLEHLQSGVSVLGSTHLVEQFYLTFGSMQARRKIRRWFNHIFFREYSVR